MSDIIERLETEAGLCRNETATDIAMLLDEAALEIGNERRRTQNVRKELSDLDAYRIGQIEKLRAALKRIAEGDYGPDDKWQGPAAIATEALRSTAPNSGTDVPKAGTGGAADQPSDALAIGCSRSYPHEDMNAECERLTGMARAISEIASERQRQVSVEGWTPAHDDSHKLGQLAIAAGCYAIHAGQFTNAAKHGTSYKTKADSGLWPWSDEWWKPKDPRRDLIRAAALLVAEIERLDRLAVPATEGPPK